MRCLIEAVEKKFDALREADREAVRLAHADLSNRLKGFPQQFATKDEMQAALQALQRLEKDAVTREIYETQSKALAAAVAKLDKESLPEREFQVFVENYRIEEANAAIERRAVASALATATAREVGERTGVSMSAGLLIGGLAALGGIISIVVIAANLFA